MGNTSRSTTDHTVLFKYYVYLQYCVKSEQHLASGVYSIVLIFINDAKNRNGYS